MSAASHPLHREIAAAPATRIKLEVCGCCGQEVGDDKENLTLEQHIDAALSRGHLGVPGECRSSNNNALLLRPLEFFSIDTFMNILTPQAQKDFQ